MPGSELVLLKGGPSDAPQVVRAPSGEPGSPVKVAYGNGYEYYQFAGEYADIGEGPMPVYRWVYHKPGAE